MGCAQLKLFANRVLLSRAKVLVFQRFVPKKFQVIAHLKFEHKTMTGQLGVKLHDHPSLRVSRGPQASTIAIKETGTKKGTKLADTAGIVTEHPASARFIYSIYIYINILYNTLYTVIQQCGTLWELHYVVAATSTTCAATFFYRLHFATSHLCHRQSEEPNKDAVTNRYCTTKFIKIAPIPLCDR